MVTVEKKLLLLDIDTTSLSSSLSACMEEESERTVDGFTTDRSIPSTTAVRQRRLTATSNKRYSTSYLNHPINIYNSHQEDLRNNEKEEEIMKGHKRSTSAGNEYFFLSRNYSSPDLKRESTDAKHPIKGVSPSTLKKRWFQLPRMSLIRQASTPPKSFTGIGGLKAPLVEPPEPPPQLLFNLDWSSKNSSPPLLWNNDVNNHSVSTPTSPIIQRRSSGYGFDVIVSSDTTTLTDNNNANNGPTMIPTQLTRRLSCPGYENVSTASETYDSPESTPPSTPIEINPKLRMTPANCNGSKLFSSFQRPVPKRKPSTDSSSVAPSASSSTSSASSSSILTPPSSPLLGQGDKYKPLLFNVYAPNSGEFVLNFANIKPRMSKLRRKVNNKMEQRALLAWQNQLLLALDKIKCPLPRIISPDKKARYLLTRKFILREFYTTEINYWNQLNYTKVMFADPLQLALDRNSDMVRPNDLDWFANLNDLMRFSSNLILRLRNVHVERSTGNVCDDSDINPCCKTCPNDVKVGQVLRESAEQMVTFLNCALDYRSNRKLLDSRKHNKGYTLYNEKLASRKETRHFTLQDYLIVPIQRITRYGLLLADLEKHTDSSHPDFQDIIIARAIVHSLAAAMNSVQKKT